MLGDPIPAPSPDVRRTDPETSHEAARRARNGSGVLRALVLAVHRRHAASGLTDDELSQRLPSAHPGSVAKRRQEAAAAWLIAPTDERRPTRRGVSAVVWKITAAGIEAADLGDR